MMYITTDLPKLGITTSEWHVGEGKVDWNTGLMQCVIEVYADCDELEYVLARFKNLPYVEGKRSMTWHGDFAKLIVANLG